MKNKENMLLLKEVEKELLKIKQISLQEFGISLVDERLLSSLKEATQEVTA